ncbi:hypothetical protein Tco_0140184 [Tanacetum coccineum]
MARNRHQVARTTRRVFGRNNYNRTLEAAVDPERQLEISRERRANLVPAEVLYSNNRNTARHRVYEHYSEQRILCIGENQINLRLCNEESYENLRNLGLQHIHLGIFMIRLHALHRKRTQLVYTFPDMILSVNDFHNHVEVAIQTHGYDTWQGGESNLLITMALTGRLSNTSYMGFQYSVENVVDHLTTTGITAIPGERRSIEELEGMSWHLKPPEQTSVHVPSRVAHDRERNDNLDEDEEHFIGICLQTPQEEHISYDVCFCESCLDEARILEEEPLNKVRRSNKPKRSRQRSEERWSTLGEPSGKWDYYVRYNAPPNTTPIEEIAATGWGDEFSDDEVTLGKVTILEERTDWDDDERSGGKQELESEWENPFAAKRGENHTILHLSKEEENNDLPYPKFRNFKQVAAQIIKKHEEHAFPSTSQEESTQSYQPPRRSKIFSGGYGEYYNSQWTLPPAWTESEVMLVLPADPGLWSEVISRWESITINRLNNQTWSDNKSKLVFMENLLGESEKLMWQQWRTVFPEAYYALEAITDEPQNITSQVRQLILLEDLYRGSTKEQDRAYRDLDRITCEETKNLWSFLEDFRQLATKSGRLYFPSTTKKLFAKLPPSPSKRIEESFRTKHHGLNSGVLPAIKFTHTFISEMCKDAALGKELRDLSLCSAIPIPGYYKNNNKKYGMRKSRTYKGKPLNSHVKPFKRKYKDDRGRVKKSVVYQELDLDDNWDIVSADFDDSSVYSILEGEGDTHQSISVMVQDTPVEETVFMAIEEDDESDDDEEDNQFSHHAFMFHHGSPTKIAEMVQIVGSWKPNKELPAKKEEKDFSNNEVKLLKELLKEKTEQVQHMIRDQAKEYYENKAAMQKKEETWQSKESSLVMDLTDALKIIDQLIIEKERLEEQKDEEIRKLKAQLQKKEEEAEAQFFREEFPPLGNTHVARPCIETEVHYSGNATANTRASTCCINKKVIPKEALEPLTQTVVFNGLNSRHQATHRIKQDYFLIEENKFKIPLIYDFDMSDSNEIAELEVSEEEFLEINESFYFNQERSRAFQEQFKPVIDRLKQQGYIEEEPLKHWKKNGELCKLDIINPDITIEDRPLKHVTPAMEDLFRKHVDSLLKIGAIRPSKSRHRTMAMIVNSGTTIDPVTGREVKGINCNNASNYRTKSSKDPKLLSIHIK